MTVVNAIGATTQNDSTTTAKTTDTGEAFASYMNVPTSLYDIFQKASKTYNVSAELLMSVGMAESSFNPNAVSHMGAQGVMQLMPATAAELGVTDSFDPEQNIMGGAKYLSQMLQKYNGNVTLACAAYNAGSNSVDKYGGVPPYEETQNYVKTIANYMSQGVTAPTTPLSSTGSSSSSSSLSSTSSLVTTPVVLEEDDSSSALDDLFSYDDYLKFLDIYFNQILDVEKNDSSSSSQEEQEEENDKTSSYLGLQNIKYNNSIMNLLKSTDTSII